LSEAPLALADAEVTIPTEQGADSLNVAAATAVLLYGLHPEQKPG
jgi:tRNA G18 (ribose-2'-O)-methylase SpoU